MPLNICYCVIHGGAPLWCPSACMFPFLFAQPCCPLLLTVTVGMGRPGCTHAGPPPCCSFLVPPVGSVVLSVCWPPSSWLSPPSLPWHCSWLCSHTARRCLCRARPARPSRCAPPPATAWALRGRRARTATSSPLLGPTSLSTTNPTANSTMLAKTSRYARTVFPACFLLLPL